MSDSAIEVPTPEVQTADLQKRLEALERTVQLIPVGFCGIWLGAPPASTSGEVHLRPGLLFCNGAEILQDEWPMLWSAWGKTHLFGAPGDPAAFKLPNLIDRMPWAKGISGTRTAVGATGGLDRVILLATEMPQHNHPGSAVSVSDSAAGTHSHTFNSGARIPVGITTGSTDFSTAGTGFQIFRTGTTMDQAGSHTHPHNASLTIANQGTGTSHENMPPYTVVEAWGVVAGFKAV